MTRTIIILRDGRSYVDDGHMIGPHFVRTLQAMSLETLQLRCLLFMGAPLACIRNDLGVLGGIDVQFALDAEQDRVVHDIEGGEEVGILSDRLVDSSAVVS